MRNAIELVRCIVTQKRPALFRGRHFDHVIICAFAGSAMLAYVSRPGEIMTERSLAVDHVTRRWMNIMRPGDHLHRGRAAEVGVATDIDA